MTKKEHTKPVGVDGSLTHESGPDIDERTFNRYVSPKAKAAIEVDVANKFVELALATGEAASFEQLPENDLDFAWASGDRRAKIELTELTLATPPYRETGQSAVIQYKPWGEKFFDLVQKKDSKSYREKLPIDLLVYTTHYAYHGNRFCVDLAAERLRHYGGGAAFDRVYYLSFSGEVSELYLLKPYRPALAPKLRREYEGQWYANMDFANGTEVPGGTRFEVTFPPRH